MPVLAITASFPLGVYLGHGGDGTSRDRFPDTARLHAALLHAAGKGVTAVERGADLRPGPESLHALEWLEAHPPNALRHPDHRFVGGSERVLSYRAEGVSEKDPQKGGLRDRKMPQRICDGVAVASEFGWRWDDAPAEVVRVIESLCPDVSCLGESDSPALLRVTEFVPTHYLQENAGQFSTRGLAVRSPAPGRTEAWEAAYDTANPTRRPSTSADRWSQTQLPSPSPVVQAATHTRHYAIPAPPPVQAPWTRVQVFPVTQEIDLADRVAWCVTFHRMLAHRLGDDAPPVLTGKYPRDVKVPANRLAIHYLDRSQLTHLGLDGPAFVVLLPQAMTTSEWQAYMDATSGRLALYREETRLVTHCDLEVAADEFWPTVEGDERRLWRTLPAMVAETRRQPDGGSGPWTLEHAALLALGFVFRDRMTPVGKGLSGYLDLVGQVRASGARVVSAMRVADSRVERYAHKLPDSLVTQPFVATLDLGSLVGPRTLLAVGQARHVGGGLLHPASGGDGRRR